MIEVLNLTNTGRKIIESVSFSIENGEIVGLIGKNGAGKTTICDMITGFLPYSGSVTVSETNANSKIGYMPEKNPLYPDLKVLEYLQFVAGIKGAEGNSAKEIAEKFDLPVSSYICCLSKEMQKKLCLAAAVINNPEVLILDEPAEGLSPDAKASLFELIKEVSENKAVLICATASEEIFDRIITLNNEAMLSDLDETDELLDNSELENILEEELLDDISEIEDAHPDNENEEDAE